MYMQMCNEGTRGEKRRRDADDFDPESKLMDVSKGFGFTEDWKQYPLKIKSRECFWKYLESFELTISHKCMRI